MFRAVALIVLLGAQGALAGTNPVEKVITLLTDLKTEIEADGTEESTTYDKFACWCKDNTEEKSTSIEESNTKIEDVSASIQEKTATKAEKETEVQTRKKKEEELRSELEETVARCKRQEAEYDAGAADMSKAISSLEGAVKAMSASKPAAANLLSLKKTLAMAEALNMIKPAKKQALGALLQQGSSVDPEDPEYKFHSSSIVDILENLLGDFKTSKSDLDDEWGKTKKSCDETTASLSKEIEENANAITTLEGDIETLVKEIADHRKDLIEEQGSLEDDQLFLKDLTKRCELRAQDWDQRAQMRGDEVRALSQALEILEGKVKELDSAVNERALLIESAKPQIIKKAVVLEEEPKASGMFTSLERQLAMEDARTLRSISFLQAGAQRAGKKDRAVAMIRSAGERLDSPVLSQLALKMAADPFKKVKTLIQNLIERLLSEAAAEATKKGFCDTEVGKARKNRDYRFASVKKLSADLAELEAKKDELEIEIKKLGEDIETITDSLQEAADLRETEKEENIETIQKAKQGHEAVTEALVLLKAFYKQASRAKVLLQQRASPIDETAPEVASGAYKGKQGASKGILGLLEVIAADFARTLKETKAAEKRAQADFVEFDRTSKSDIGAKETSKELNGQDFNMTKTNIEKKTSDMVTNQDLVDKALGELEALKPVCIDTGMSYSARVEKREEEISALKNALCILDPEKKESECA